MFKDLQKTAVCFYFNTSKSAFIYRIWKMVTRLSKTMFYILGINSVEGETFTLTNFKSNFFKASQL